MPTLDVVTAIPARPHGQATEESREKRDKPSKRPVGRLKPRRLVKPDGRYLFIYNTHPADRGLSAV